MPNTHFKHMMKLKIMLCRLEQIKTMQLVSE